MAKRLAKGKGLRKLGNATDISLGDFSTRAMREYGSFVLMDRAVSDVRDGLKPVQRRILWAMYKLKVVQGYKKSAKIVGDVMGNYHPHSGEAIYGTLVNLVGDRYPLIEGHGNFGSPTDSPASMRYTEAKLSKIASFMLADIAVGDFVPNYSGDLEEPLVLPSRLPLLLMNGSSGIGVGVRAVLPPHNLLEILKVISYFIRSKRPKLSIALRYLKGPDYGYGVLLSTDEEVHNLYETGRGTLKYRCEYEFEDTKQGRSLLVKSLAPGFNMSNFLSKMGGLARDGLLSYCSDDSTDCVRIHIGFKDPSVIRDRVIPELHSTQSYQFYTVKRNDESTLDHETLFQGGLFRLVDEWVSFRRLVENKRIRRELRVEKAKLLRVEAVLAALANLDKVYEVLKTIHKGMDSMRSAMSSALGLSDKQAGVILEMKVHRLARMNSKAQKESKIAILDRMSGLREDLKDIDRVILSGIKELSSLSDSRGTLSYIDSPTPALSGVDSSKYVVVQGTRVTRLDKVPTRRHKFEFLASDTSSVLFVFKDNKALRFNFSYGVADSLPSAPVGVVPGSSSVLCSVDDRGLLSMITPPTKSEFNVMRGATSLTSAAAVPAGGTLVLVSAEGLGRSMDPERVKGSRAFSLGKKPFPGESKWRKYFPSKVFGVSKDYRLYSSSGRCLAPKYSGGELVLGSIQFKSPGLLFLIGPRNFVLTTGDRRDIVDRKAALLLLKSGSLAMCWPL